MFRAIGLCTTDLTPYIHHRTYYRKHTRHVTMKLILDDATPSPQELHYDVDTRQATFVPSGNRLPDHPDADMMTKQRAPVLTNAHADHELRAPLVDASREVWTVHSSNTSEAFVRVLYVREEAFALQKRFVHDAMDATVIAMTNGAVVHDEKAGGCYVVGGVACLPVREGTRSVQSPTGRRFVVPYIRKSTLDPSSMNALRKVAPLMGAAARALDRVWTAITNSLSLQVREVPFVGDRFMFPSANEQRAPHAGSLRGAACISCHQVAVRLLEPSSAWRHRCALHVDTGDAPTRYGVPLLYFNRGSLDGDWVGDLLVFEHTHGGRAVRIKVAVSGYVCIVVFRSDICLHGNVFPTLSEWGDGETGDDCSSETHQKVVQHLPDLVMKVIPFLRGPIDTMCQQMSVEMANALLGSRDVPGSQ